MTFLERYAKYESPRSKIKSFLEQTGLDKKVKSTINDDYTVDIVGNVYVEFFNMDKFSIKFGKIHGDFHFNYCSLVTLTNGPIEVESFDCGYNNLESLEGGPKIINGHTYWAHHNFLKSLYGLPTDFEGELYISGNPVFHLIKSILPKKIDLLTDEGATTVNKFAHYLNEFGVISNNGNEYYVDETRLQDAYHLMVGSKLDLSGKEYIKSQMRAPNTSNHSKETKQFLYKII